MAAQKNIGIFSILASECLYFLVCRYHWKVTESTSIRLLLFCLSVSCILSKMYALLRMLKTGLQCSYYFDTVTQINCITHWCIWTSTNRTMTFSETKEKMEGTTVKGRSGKRLYPWNVMKVEEELIYLKP